MKKIIQPKGYHDSMAFSVKIISLHPITHDVKCFRVEKPSTFNFFPGQAVDVAINTRDMKDKKRPFTLTSLNTNPYLEFIIKNYEQETTTSKLHSLGVGDNLLISEPFGTIRYKGPGLFIAAGTGITPFLAIFRQLREENNIEGNKLLFSNKTHQDIIAEKELVEMLGKNAVFTLTRKQAEGYAHGRIAKETLKQYLDIARYYICGPIQFVVDIKNMLDALQVKPENVVLEL